MDQLGLFERPKARRGDPETAHLAGEQVERSGVARQQRALALGAVDKWPGRTSRELAKLSGLDRYALARRLPELREAGLVEQGPQRMCGVGRRQALTWKKSNR